MSEEESEDSHLVKEVEGCFGITSTGQALHEKLSEVAERLNDNIRAMQRLMPYLTNLYYTDSQWRIAEREMLRLEKQRQAILKEYTSARILIESFQRAVVTTT